MLITRADSIDVASLPPNLPAYAGYIDGRWPSWDPLVARFKDRAHLTSITVLGGAAQIADVEAGALSIEQGAIWLARVNENPGVTQRHGLYFSVSNLSAVRQAIAKHAPKLPRSAYLLWGARWTGTLPKFLPPDLDALQAIDLPGYDLSVVAPSWFTPR